jgi:hypothetical protein
MNLELYEPKFHHDCDKCEFLGGYKEGDERADVYICPSCLGMSVIARLGDDGPDYYSSDIRLMLAHETGCFGGRAALHFVRELLRNGRIELTVGPKKKEPWDD